MRADSITLLFVGGLVAFAGCEGGGAVSGTAPSDDSPYDTPPSTYQKPPSDFDDVNDYQKPSSGDVCESICGFYEVVQCAGAGDGPGEGGRGNDGNGGDRVLSPAECRASCTRAIGAIACEHEVVSLIDCLLHTAGLTCDLLRHAQDGDVKEMDVAQLQACQSAVDAYSACEDQSGGPGPTCAPPNTCGGCEGDCARCNCEHPGDPTMCMRMCANGR